MLIFIFDIDHTAETFLTVHTVASCDAKLQEFARIIFVDNVLNHPRKIEHHAPLKKKPSYDSVSLAAPKIVRISFIHIS